jgi:hypothetical protein
VSNQNRAETLSNVLIFVVLIKEALNILPVLRKIKLQGERGGKVSLILNRSTEFLYPDC